MLGCLPRVLDRENGASAWGHPQMFAPDLRNSAICGKGQYCFVTLISGGTLLQANDRLTFLPQCGSGDFLSGFPSNYLTTSSGMLFQFPVTDILFAEPGMNRMCWCRWVGWFGCLFLRLVGLLLHTCWFERGESRSVWLFLLLCSSCLTPCFHCSGLGCRSEHQ